MNFRDHSQQEESGHTRAASLARQVHCTPAHNVRMVRHLHVMILEMMFLKPQARCSHDKTLLAQEDRVWMRVDSTSWQSRNYNNESMEVWGPSVLVQMADERFTPRYVHGYSRGCCHNTLM